MSIEGVCFDRSINDRSCLSFRTDESKSLFAGSGTHSKKLYYSLSINREYMRDISLWDGRYFKLLVIVL